MIDPRSSLLASAREAVALVGPSVPAHDDFVAALEAHGAAALDREGPPAHLTASLFVFDSTGEQILLCLHGKGRFWVQPGGHLEAGDTSLAQAAARELEEETGVSRGLLRDVRVVDLDHHPLSSRFGRCASHLDVGVAAVVDRDAVALQVSDESDDLAWFPLDDLPSPLPPAFDERLARVRAAYAVAR
ncbi:NUDIX hydrolase [Microbacterium sp. JZ101]